MRLDRGRIVLIVLGLLVLAWGVWIYPMLLGTASAETLAVQIRQASDQGRADIALRDLRGPDFDRVCIDSQMLVFSHEGRERVRMAMPSGYGALRPGAVCAGPDARLTRQADGTWTLQDA